MDVFSLTRELVDMESITGSEERIGDYLFELLGGLASRFGGQVEKMEVERGGTMCWRVLASPW